MGFSLVWRSIMKASTYCIYIIVCKWKLQTHQWCQSHRLCLTIQHVEALHLKKEILWIKWHCDRLFSEHFVFHSSGSFPPYLLFIFHHRLQTLCDLNYELHLKNCLSVCLSRNTGRMAQYCLIRGIEVLTIWIANVTIHTTTFNIKNLRSDQTKSF